MTREMNRYLRTVCRQIPFPCRKKCRAELKCSLEEFAEQNPACTEETLCARFGTPAEFADSFLLALPQKKRLKSVQVQRFVTAASFAALAVICLLFLAAAAYILIHSAQPIPVICK